MCSLNGIVASIKRNKHTAQHNPVQTVKKIAQTQNMYLREIKNPRKWSSYVNTIQIKYLNAIPKHKQIKKKMLLGCCMLLCKQINYLFCPSVTYNLYFFGIYTF